MSHAPKSKNISDYNTFQVFDEIYGSAKPTHFGELDRPEKSNSGNAVLAWLLLLIFIFTLGASLHPLASYFLKTPYPLVAVGGDAMSPTLKKNDLILVQGLPNLTLFQPGDVIVYLVDPENKIFSIERIKAFDGDAIIVKGDNIASLEKTIYLSQIVGRAVTLGRSVKLPLIGALNNLLVQR